MTRSIKTLALLALAALSLANAHHASAQAVSAVRQAVPANLGFEERNAMLSPVGWAVTGTRYQITVDSIAPLAGAFSLRSHWAGSDAPRSGPPGNVLLRYPVQLARGRRLHLSGYIRTEGVTDGYAGFMMSVDAGLAFDNMPARGARGTTPWTRYDIELPVDVSASGITLGIIHSGNGTAWFDSLTIEVVGPADAPVVPSPLEPPRAIDARGMENLVAFARLFGIARYFVATEAVRTTNWHDFALRGIRQVESSRDAANLASTLQTLFSRVAPDNRILVAGAPAPRRALPLDTGRAAGVAVWTNTGIQGGGVAGYYNGALVVRPAPGGIVPTGTLAPDSSWSGTLAGGVQAVVPLSRWVELPAEESLRLRRPQPAPLALEASPNDRATRLAGAIVAWNVIRHGYPYFDVAHADWDAVLRRTLAAAAADSTPSDYLVTLRRMVAALNDGHGTVNSSSEAKVFFPVTFDWVENQLVIDFVAPQGLTTIRRGDVVLAVNGVAANTEVTEREKLISAATPQWRRARALVDLRTVQNGAPLVLRIRPADGGPVREVRLDAGGSALPPADTIAEARPGIFYVNLSRISSASLNAALPALAAAKGIVFDMRGYPTPEARAVLQHLSRDTLNSINFLTPIFSRPDMEDATWRNARWTLPPLAPYIGGNVAFLTGSGTISFAESIMGIVEENKLGEIVGGATAGTNGTVNSFQIPSGFTIVFTGMKVTKVDGSPHHGVGIKPTVPVARTLKGVAEGRDEVLEKSIALLQGRLK